MSVDERSALLPNPSLASAHIVENKPRRSVTSGVFLALVGEWLSYRETSLGLIVDLLRGVFIASADETLVLAIYGAISSDFENLSDGPFLMTGYTLGYCVALPMVSDLSSLS